MWQPGSKLVSILPPLHTVEISLWDDATLAGQAGPAVVYLNVVQQMCTDVVVSAWGAEQPASGHA